MKRVIRATLFNSNDERTWPPEYSSLYNAANLRNYEMTLTEDLDIDMFCTKDAEMMPKLSLHKVIENGKYYYDVTAQFPELSSVMLDFYDSIHHWIKQWERVGDLCSTINKFSYNPKTSVDVE